MHCSFRLSACIALGLLAPCFGVSSHAAGTERVSVDSAGVEGGDDSFYAAISPNGRYVAFVSRAPNLVPGGATYAESDAFVHDRKTGETECISLDPAGVDGNGQSSFPALSANGRFVAFESAASTLVPEDLNTEDDVFLRDRKTGAIERLSVDAAGVEGDGRSHEAAISGNGRYVAFQSSAENLVPEDENELTDVFVRDRKEGTIARVSVGPGGSEANGGDSENPAISANGRFVAFHSSATDLVADDGNALQDVFVHDRKTGETERISFAITPVETDGDSRYASLSGSGRYVAFQSEATNLVEEDGNGRVDIFVHDRNTGVTTRVSVSTAGVEADSGSFSPVISGNGRIVAFESGAENLVAVDGNKTTDIFAYDRKRGVMERVSVDGAGTEADGESNLPAISANGRHVAFEAGAENLVPSDGNLSIDVFVRDRK